MAEDMNQIFENADITRRDDDGELNMDRTTAEEQNKCKFVKELLRTVSSCFETPVWGTCTGTEPHVQCLMLNHKRMPDSVIAIVPENNVVDLRYPIFITEVLGSKDSKGTNEEKYNGFNAAMQSLVFAPRAYYCEVIVGDTKIYILEKQPHIGYIQVESKHYRLYVAEDFKRFLQDVCSALIDGMVQLSPIAEYSSRCLKAGGYRDFLNLRSSNKNPIEPHCWHLFLPKYLGQDRAEVPGDFLATLDFEDPVRDEDDPEFDLHYIPSILNVTPDVFHVTETNIDLNEKLEDLSCIRAVRDEYGKPVEYDSINETIVEVSKNVTIDAKISRLKEFMDQYGSDDVKFLEVVDEEDEPLHDRITATIPDEDDPFGENAIDVEMDSDNTIISTGGALVDNLIIYDKEGKLSICAKDRFRPRTTVRSKHRITFDAEEFAKLSSMIESIHEGYVEDGTLPQPTPVKEYDPQDPLEISLFKTPRTPRTWSRTPRQTPGPTPTRRSSRRLTFASLKKKSVPPRKRLIAKKSPETGHKKPKLPEDENRNDDEDDDQDDDDNLPSTSKGKISVSKYGRVIYPKSTTKKSATPKKQTPAKGRGT